MSTLVVSEYALIFDENEESKFKTVIQETLQKWVDVRCPGLRLAGIALVFDTQENADLWDSVSLSYHAVATAVQAGQAKGAKLAEKTKQDPENYSE